MRPSLILKVTLISLFIGILLGGHVMADKKTAMRRRKAAKVDKYDEVLKMTWPEADKWKLDNTHANNARIIEFYYPDGQNSNSWREMGTIEIEPLSQNANLSGIARTIFLGTQQASPHAEWKILYKGQDDKGYNYIVFQITCPDFLSGEQPQLQYWKMIHGDQNLFTIQYTYKNETMPDEKQLTILEAIDNAHIELVEKEAEKTEEKKE